MTFVSSRQTKASLTKQPGIGTTVLFTLTSLLASTLLFQVQPLVGRLLLPLAGGTNSLWNTAMVFFQATLLLGYGATHLAASRFSVRNHVLIQVGALAAASLTLPLAAPSNADGVNEAPIMWVLLALASMIGLLFLVLSSSSPTLQRWLATTTHPSAENPYFLYAAGNFGSLVSLLAYPIVIEPNFTLSQQTTMWGTGFVLLVAATAACGFTAARFPRENYTRKPVVQSKPISWSRRLRWVLIAAVPSSLLLGVTQHITTDVAAFPLLWVMPLVLFLATFVVAFSPRGEAVSRHLPVVVLLATVAMLFDLFRGNTSAVWTSLGIHLVGFFVLCLAAHCRLSNDRPPADRLTEFFLLMSLGGVLGGATTALLAPVVADRLIEYPLVIALAVGVAGASVPALRQKLIYLIGAVVIFLALQEFIGLPGNTALAVVGAVAAYLAIFRSGKVAAALLGTGLLLFYTLGAPKILRYDRSFFGTYEVADYRSGAGYTERVLTSGTTRHGQQNLSEAEEPIARSYYHSTGPIGDVMRSRPDQASVGVVGLGAGETAAYGRPGDTMTFFEIDQKVVDIAHESGLFSYTQTSKADVDIQVGDGRLLLANSSDKFDILTIDAFSSDSIPVHLLTTEAVQIYLDSLEEDGILMIHVTNRHMSLAPVVAGLAADNDVYSRSWDYSPSDDLVEEGVASTEWVAITRDPAILDNLEGPWEEIEPEGRLWTDDFSDVISVIDF